LISIKKEKDFKKIRAEGRRITGKLGVAYLLDGERLEAGICASRKTGNAVKRNRIKRKIRAAFRKNGDVKGKILIYASSQAIEMTVEEIQRSIYEMFKRAGMAT